MSHAEPPTHRLASAIRLSLAFRAAGRTDHEAFLAEHPDLRDLLEPMLLFEAAPTSGDSVTPESALLPTIAVGQSLGGYRLLRELGRGGMGTVFLAWQRTLDRTVAVKVLSSPLLRVSERALWRFRREGQLLADVDHPAIVKVIEASVHDGLPFLAMELVPGASLATVLGAVRRAGLQRASGELLRAAVFGAAADDGAPTAAWRLPGEYGAAIASLVADVAEALHAAHRVGVVHRDVKPSNVLVRRDGQALLADFGVARQEGDTPLTVTGDVAGTPCYMAPEQIRGEPATARSDVFALGIVLYEALTLRLPFPGADTAAAVECLLHEEPVDVRRGTPHCSRALAAITHRALAKNPAHRYPDAAAFAADLRAALAGRPIVARPPSRAAKLWHWTRREPWRAVAIGAGAALTVALVSADRVAAHRLRAEAERATSALNEVRQLEIRVRLDRAENRAAELRLPRIEELPDHLAWLREHGEPLAAELPGLEALLAAVQAAAAPYDEAAAAADRAGHPDAAELQIIDDELAWQEARELADADAAELRDERIRNLRAARPPLAERVGKRRTWRFDDPRRQFLHDELLAQVVRLRRFVHPDSGALAKLRLAAEFAVENHRRCLVEPLELWRRIAADVAADPRYGGLVLRPQVDLVPLGKNSQGFWEFVHLPSGETDRQVPERGPDGTLLVTPGSGIVLVLLPGGAFWMGAQAKDAQTPNHDPEALAREGPPMKVTLAPFFCGKYEVTAAQWQRLAGDTPSIHRPPDSRESTATWPVTNIAQKRAKKTLQDVRLQLPTEAQWEYACRAGSNGPFAFSPRSAAASHANFADRSAAPWMQGRTVETEFDDGAATLAGVGSYQPNAFGLHDLHGNVAELVGEPPAPMTRPREGPDGACTPNYSDVRTTARGGYAQSRLSACRASERSFQLESATVSQWVGCRAIRSVDP